MNAFGDGFWDSEQYVLPLTLRGLLQPQYAALAEHISNRFCTYTPSPGEGRRREVLLIYLEPVRSVRASTVTSLEEDTSRSPCEELFESSSSRIASCIAVDGGAGFIGNSILPTTSV